MRAGSRLRPNTWWFLSMNHRTPWSISFAKNAAAFFKKRFSFRTSSGSFFKRRFSFINSASLIFFWILLGFLLAFFTEFFTPFRNGSFAHTIFSDDTLIRASLFKIQTNNLFLQFRGVTSWQNNYLSSCRFLLYLISQSCYNFILPPQNYFFRVISIPHKYLWVQPFEKFLNSHCPNGILFTVSWLPRSDRHQMTFFPIQILYDTIIAIYTARKRKKHWWYLPSYHNKHLPTVLPKARQKRRIDERYAWIC